MKCFVFLTGGANTTSPWRSFPLYWAHGITGLRPWESWGRNWWAAGLPSCGAECVRTPVGIFVRWRLHALQLCYGLDHPQPLVKQAGFSFGLYRMKKGLSLSFKPLPLLGGLGFPLGFVPNPAIKVPVERWIWALRFIFIISSFHNQACNFLPTGFVTV